MEVEVALQGCPEKEGSLVLVVMEVAERRQLSAEMEKLHQQADQDVLADQDDEGTMVLEV